ncbi:MAG: PqqD family protein [Desulfobulbus sp.]|jgi:hypothetical protein|uniref:PqqD family protein n=1 Tax=Desulfobulbus sp. TaxID=895 RepID=UPI00283BDBE8|nr:PqqD family protein [Desulfobulbus sp.]MDR2549869.1 PqqD family protein [Desulfobulbus sp.]
MNQVAGVFETDLYFSGVPQPVRLVRCASLLDTMGDVFPTWPFRMERCDPASTPIITVRQVKGEYRIDAPWLDESIFADTDACAFSSIVVDLIYAWLEANPQALCLHCAAAEFDGRLVVFPNTNKVGKSLLITRLMAERRTSYGDDLVALLPEGTGMSFGVPPRLRLPLPASEQMVAEFIRTHRGKADAWSQYLAPNAPGLAPFGQTRPIGAFVMLNRKPEGRAELLPADAADSLQNIVYQNLMRRGSALEVLDRSQWLTKEKPCWYLRYAHLDDAVALLRQVFVETDRGFSGPGQEHAAVWTAAAEKITPRPNRPRSRARRRASVQNYVRRPEVLIRQEQGEFFLIHATGDEIFHLNALGRAVWELLAEPLSETETVALLASVFPETSQAQIERDVIELFTAFKRKRLLLER